LRPYEEEVFIMETIELALLTDLRPTFARTDFNPLAGTHLEDPYPFYARAHEEHPVFFSPMLGAWVVTRYDDCLSVLKDPRRFSSRNSLRGVAKPCPAAVAVLATGLPQVPLIINSDPPEHTAFRLAMSGVFSPRKIAEREPHIHALAVSLIDRFSATRPLDLMSEFAYPLAQAVVAGMWSVPSTDLDLVKTWGTDLLALQSPGLSPDRQVQCAQTFVDCQRYLAELIKNRRTDRREGDPLSDMIHEEWAGRRLTDIELVSLLLMVIFAGHQTTAHLIGNAMAVLLAEPARWEALVADPSLISVAVEETLRIDAPLISNMRTTTVSVELAGIALPAGADLLLVYGAANHDATRYTHPARFDLCRRAESPHLAFGHGIHYCIGATLGRTTGRLGLQALVEQVPDLRLEPGQETHHNPALLLHGFDRLMVERTMSFART
jgi:cytochrome P450